MFYNAASAGSPYDLVAIDLEMPRVTGVEMLASLEQLHAKFNLPVTRKIIVSGNSTRSNVIATARYKCDAFFVKPIKKDQLEPKLREMGLLKPQPEPSP